MYNDDINSDDGMSINSRRMLKRKNVPNKHTYYKCIKNRNIRVDIHSTSSNVGSIIKCPYTGNITDSRVGTKNEEQYFKARLPFISNGDHVITAYYDTPESFERHHRIDLPGYIKSEFYNKNPKKYNKEETSETVVVN